MSSSESPLAFPLVIQAPASGLRITVYDGHDRVVHQAQGDTVASLPPGIYCIRSERQGRIEERIFQHPGGRVMVAPLPSWISPAPLEAPAPSITAASTQRTSRRILGTGAPPTSRLVVFVRKAHRRSRGALSDLGEGLSLRDASGASLGTFEESEILRDPTGDWIAFAAPAVPGPYILHQAGEFARDVALHLHSDFTTQVFLFHDGAPRADTLRAFLAPPDQPFLPTDEVAFAVDAGLWMLENGRGDPPLPLAAVLTHGRFENPMLGLVGAHLLLGHPRPDAGLVRGILDQLETTLPGSLDVQALRVRSALRCRFDLPRMPLTFPPMLRAGLAALVEASCFAPEILPAGSLAEHASVTLFADSPWSCWEPRAPDATRPAGSGGGQVEPWVLDGVQEATARGNTTDARTLARHLAVPLRVAESALAAIGQKSPGHGEAPPPLEGRTIVLEVISGPMSGRRFVLAEQDKVLVGRDPECKIVLGAEDDEASRYHAVIEVSLPRASIRDLGSRNGTYVNLVKRGGRRAGEAPDAAERRQEDIPLVPGDRVDMGRTALLIRTQPSPAHWKDPGEDDPAPTSTPPPSSVLGALPDIPGIEALRMLGRGGNGAVYLGRRRSTGELVAIKTMLPRGEVSERAARTFQREVASMRALSTHPSMVRILEDGIGEGGFWFVMEHCRGGSVTDLLERRGGRLPPGEAVAIVRDALPGLAHAHRNGFVHRDLKPGNLLLTELGGGRTRIGDFGLSKSFVNAGLSNMTGDTDWEGTAAFMPPEQVVRFRYAEPPTDVWSMSATLYFMITGHPPRDVAPNQVPSDAVLRNPIVPVRSRNPHVPVKLAEVIERALAREVGARPKDAEALDQALAAALA